MLKSNFPYVCNIHGLIALIDLTSTTFTSAKSAVEFRTEALFHAGSMMKHFEKLLKPAVEQNLNAESDWEVDSARVREIAVEAPAVDANPEAVGVDDAQCLIRVALALVAYTPVVELPVAEEPVAEESVEK